MTKQDLINRVKKVISNYYLNNSYAKMDMMFIAEINEAIKSFEPEQEKKFVCHHPDFGYLYTGDSVRLKDGCMLFILGLCDGFVILRYSGYYPFVIDIDRVIEKIDLINKH